MNSETHEYINTRTTDWHVLYILFHVEFCSRAYLQSEAAKSEIWARGAQREKETQPGLMRGQMSFWVKYPAWGLHVKHTPQGKRGTAQCLTRSTTLA